MMRTSNAAYAMIKHRFDQTDKYLLQINKGWNNQYNFISGHIEPEDDNNYQNTIIREVEEELPPIKYKKEFLVSSLIKKPLKTQAYSISAKKETKYTFYFFHITFLVNFDNLNFLWAPQNNDNQWFTEAELISGYGIKNEKITNFPVPQIIQFLPGGLKKIPESFI